ncbi:MAG: hypothetical protein CFH01_00049 [Alphaproteobacteria bacterium MarineAlpha2_Bin1]|nr:MAG: hypothetical protein CFH01_00049 [Alphaproteobacteria bacterium MarineAlpha2_Bin1]|tara:strand:+ start:1194 stop:1775 length:582 start_codon:yes stop_codon:yes gene_type:complete
MKKINSLYEKRVQSLNKILTKKFKKPSRVNYNNSAENIINEIKENMLKNNILDENEIQRKLLSIKGNLNSLFEIENSNGSFFKYNKERYTQVERLEGHPISKGISINILFKSDEILVAEIKREKNSKEPLHSNHDHTTVSTLKKGKLKLLIDDNFFIAERGDLWIYRPTNHHSILALENSIEILIKYPPVKTW